MRVCLRCKIEQSEDNYHVRSANTLFKINHCKTCEADKKLILRYGITMIQYLEMLKSQDNKCKICNRTDVQTGKKLAVDHCHETGRIRGLLCSKCNQAVGLLNDDPVLAENLTRYLR